MVHSARKSDAARGRLTVRFFLSASLVFLGLPGSYAQAGDPSKGKEIFTTQCAACHGNSAKGDGPTATAMGMKLPDLSNKAYLDKLGDQHLKKVIREGGAAVGKSPMMPPFGSLGDKDVEDVIAYIRSLAK
jgi:mono/diheme cytochrome c family protein